MKPEWWTNGKVCSRIPRVIEIWREQGCEVTPLYSGAALLDAHQRGQLEKQAEIDRLNKVIARMQKTMSSQAEQWSRSMAEAKREGMEEAAGVCDAEIEQARQFGPHHIPIISGVRQSIRAKAQEVKT